MQNLCLIVSENCNLRCSHCFESHSQMSLSVGECENFINQHARHISENFNVIFYGGEPFIEFKKIKEITSFIKERWSKKLNKIIITTNGTIFSDEIRLWVEENSHLLSLNLSIDGIRKSHNINRDNSFDKINQWFLNNASERIIARVTITPSTINLLYDNITFLHKYNFKSIVVNFAQLPDESWDIREAVKMSQVQLHRLACFYINNVFIKPCTLFDINIVNIIEPIYNRTFGCNIDKEIVLHSDGRQSRCRMYSAELQQKSEIIGFNSIDIKNSIEILDKKCQLCPIERLCKTCYVANIKYRGNWKKRGDFYCAITKLRVSETAFLLYNKILRLQSEGNYFKDSITDYRIMLAIRKLKTINI